MRLTPLPAQIETLRFDAIIIGAGINGTGIARDAAMRGLKVLLLDKEDLAGGTSARSARMIHGGLRYLEHAEIDLVRESLVERANLLRIAPHLVKPQALVIPFYQNNKHPAWQVRLGLLALDLLSLDKFLGWGQVISRDEILRQMPGLEPAGLTGAAIMPDAYAAYAERLCVENVLAARSHGAIVINHAPVEKLLLENGVVQGVEFSDQLDNRRYQVRAPLTVNVAGPWVDHVLAGLGRPTPRLIGGTKGSFLVVDSFPGAPDTSLFFEALADHRPVLITPWNNLYLIGTTDRRYEGDLDKLQADEDEISYLLEETNRVLPAANLSRADIRFTYAGVRPLPYQAEGTEASITRHHIIHDHAPDVAGLISIVGGKLTTFRTLAEQTVNKMFRKLGRKAQRCQTAQVPLPGAAVDDFAAFSAAFKRAADLPPATIERLLRVYGVRSQEVLALVKNGGPDLSQSFSPETGAIGAELVLAFRQELAETLADALLRRTMVGYNAQAGLDAVDAAAGLAQKYLGWDHRRAEQEVAAYRRYVELLSPREVALNRVV